MTDTRRTLWSYKEKMAMQAMERGLRKDQYGGLCAVRKNISVLFLVM